jgi:8-oxo-dGTP pyrophosphatase MutT (NUDIX family)
MSSRWRPNVTVAAYVEGEDGRLLWVRERGQDGRVVINNAAGHLEPGETPEQAVCREVLEETGCPFTPTALLGLYLGPMQDGMRYLRIAFVGTVGPRERAELDAPIVETLWLSPAEVRLREPELRSAFVLAGLADLEAGRRLPLHSIQEIPP